MALENPVFEAVFAARSDLANCGKPLDDIASSLRAAEAGLKTGLRTLEKINSGDFTSLRVAEKVDVHQTIVQWND